MTGYSSARLALHLLQTIESERPRWPPPPRWIDPTTSPPPVATASNGNTIKRPRMNDAQIEQTIQAKGLTAPRVTPADIEANIVSEHYFTAGDGFAGAASMDLPESGETPVIEPPMQLELLTFCVLILKNGFTVTGESACASPENFDAELGRKIARTNAISKVWPLMGYEMRSRLATSS